MYRGIAAAGLRLKAAAARIEDYNPRREPQGPPPMDKREVPGSAIYEKVDDAGEVHHVRHDWIEEQVKTLTGWDAVRPRSEKYTLVANGHVLTDLGDGVLLDAATGMKLYRKPPQST